jgi:hypothetical protein
LDDWISWHLILSTRNYKQLQRYRVTVHELEFSVFTSPILTTDLCKSHCHFKSHMKSSFHSLIPFLPIFCNCQFRRLDSVQFLCSQAYPGWLASRNFTVILNWTLLYNHFARTTQKTQFLYFWEGVFAAPLHSYPIVACVFIAAEMYLPSRCLAMNGYSDFAIPVFGRHVTINILLWSAVFHCFLIT